MKLYHFTAREYLPSIARHGLWKGDVPISRHEGLNAVNLTSVETQDGHGLEGAGGGGKQAVRLSVEIDPESEPLERWAPFAAKHLKRKWRRAIETGKRPGTWFLYWGIIAPERLSMFDMEANTPGNLADYIEAASRYESAPPTTNTTALRNLDLASASIAVMLSRRP